jgi:hypothetical protein
MRVLADMLAALEIWRKKTMTSARSAEMRTHYCC